MSDLTWTYAQSDGHLRGPNGKSVAIGYSGHGEGMNNPAWQDHVGVGPIPVGLYTIGPPHEPVDHLGPLALPLIPDKGNDMLGRSGFWIHGDNARLNHSASNGCIILSRGFRQQIADSYVRRLRVIAEDKPEVAV